MTVAASCSLQDLDTWARTVWGEARGEPFAGQLAVSWVILNRVMSGRWAKTLHGVCMQPEQFSCWNGGDPNQEKCVLVTFGDRQLTRIFRMNLKVLEGGYDDPTGGATHYFAASIQPPKWAAGAVPIARIGHHLFYNL